MKIVFRTDSSIYIGTGHVMRCLVLAQLLRESGNDIQFCIREQEGSLLDLIIKKGFIVHKLINPKIWKKPENNSDYASWLQVTEKEDATSFCNTIIDADIVIVDHYGLNLIWESHIKTELNCRLVVIDDLLREHNCDLLLDQTLDRKVNEYTQILPQHAKVITGCEYALLNPNFSKQRSESNNKITKKVSKHKVLVTMGGIDNANATIQVLKELVRYGLHNYSLVTVVINPKSPSFENVINYIRNYSNYIFQIDFVDNMAKLMQEHTISVGTPGTTSWERACLGIPSIVVPLADNQNTVCRQLTKYGSAIKVELSELPFTFTKAFRKLIVKYEQYRNNCFKLCDGLGVYRVGYQINMLKYDNVFFYNCRKASIKDIEIVFKWQSSPNTRKFALNHSLPSLNEHTLWMKKKLEANFDFFYIIQIATKSNDVVPAGVVRLDKLENSEFLLSIYIAPEYYGKGVAKSALSYIDMVHRNIVINATVLSENIASQKLFNTAGYMRLSDEHFQRPIIGNTK
jgi:UDP-2,4-diacetamido-2,4,6-trideoxy-beta-L-altropyranose hydrolase